MAKLTAHAKLQGKPNLPARKTAPAKWGGGAMLVPHPQDLLELMESIPEGKVISATTLRACLAKTYGTEITCPMVTGIFMNVVAQAAEEDRAAGVAQITPYWRTLKANFELNPRYPGGLEAHQALLEGEGHRVITKGKRRFIANASDLREPKLTLKTKKPLQIDEVAP